MSRTKYLGACLLLGLFVLPADLLAAGREGGARWFQLNTRLRVEYDDNVYLTETDEQDSFKFIAEAELFLNFNWDQTFLSLRYRPSYVYWTDREPEDTDFNHDIDFVFNHEFTPRLSLSLKDTFRISQLPELIDRGTTVRGDNDYVYNTAAATVSYRFSRQTRADLAGKYDILRYDDQATADLSDYDIWTAGLNLRQQLVPETAIQGELRYESTAYDVATNKDSDKIQVGGAIEQTFNPGFIGRARLGYESKQFDSTTIDDSDQPYGDVTLTLLPSPDTRLSLGGGVAQTETDVANFANQTRYQFFASAAHDWTARLSAFLTGTYIMGDLDATQSVAVPGQPAVTQDGEEDIFQLSARLAYRINRSHTLEAGWQLVDLSSDVRDDYTRNRLNLGWKAEL